ncbi:hypothetical protein GQ004_004075 [Salmonella enterica]|nr:hypothetical protein [Salmonella enterica subsp. enterica serovar Thompson]EDT6777883.1 hypothetical protein [Salmonella enterica subsp. enterica]EDU6324905.1 hypothetical protein [Salmonella enterica subsp. enterica serovar Edinburgh]EDX2367693.1 hypothetical protein [Salmonella enterica subsp. enterica serovar Memphis]EDX2438799.1 hypothetical protein [Salmonella enterica subsp. enterica serovar Koenigstuhl]EDZ0968011.1 hypothetical protein [Salmonella enterica]EGI6214120.1 hypothetical 
MPDGAALIRPTNHPYVGRIRRLRRHPATAFFQYKGLLAIKRQGTHRAPC